MTASSIISAAAGHNRFGPRVELSSSVIMARVGVAVPGRGRTVPPHGSQPGHHAGRPAHPAPLRLLPGRCRGSGDRAVRYPSRPVILVRIRCLFAGVGVPGTRATAAHSCHNRPPLSSFAEPPYRRRRQTTGSSWACRCFTPCRTMERSVLQTPGTFDEQVQPLTPAISSGETPASGQQVDRRKRQATREVLRLGVWTLPEPGTGRLLGDRREDHSKPFQRRDSDSALMMGVPGLPNGSCIHRAWPRLIEALCSGSSSGHGRPARAAGEWTG